MTAPDRASLEVQHLSMSFGGFKALNDVSLRVSSGERLGIIGPNGSGKTTLMNCISGALRPNLGKIWIDGEEVTRLPAHRRARLGVARTFQIPRPFRRMTVRENVMVPLTYCASVALTASHEDEACRLLEEFGLAAHASRLPDALSQVQQRKLELARALAARPKVLISDEAMAGLAHAEVDEVLDVIRKVSARGVTVIMIEHIMRAITAFSERLVCLQAGKLIADGSVDAVLAEPQVREAYLGT